MELLLVTILTLLVSYSIVKMLKNQDDLHALAFFTLFIYTIFGQIGYVYYPEISKFIGAYFGESIFFKYWIFTFLSFLLSFWLYNILYRINLFRSPLFKIKHSGSKYGTLIFHILSLCIYIGLASYFYTNRELFKWGGGNSLQNPVFAVFFRFFLLVTLIHYIKFRSKKSNIIKSSILAIFVIFILDVSISVGSRSDILYFAVGILFYELQPLSVTFKNHKKKILYTIVFLIFLIKFLSLILDKRVSTSGNNFSSLFDNESNSSLDTQDFSQVLLLQDYYTPSHLLFISIEYEYVDLLETIKSNIANSLVGIKYPQLSYNLTKLIGYDFERGESWGYHQFVEGFNALGWFGILYNMIIWNFGILLWLKISSCNDEEFSKAVKAIMAVFIISMMRNQSWVYVKFLWMSIIPAIILLLLSTNKSIAVLRK